MSIFALSDPVDPNDRTGTVAVLSQAAVLSHAAALSPRLGTCAGTTKYTNDFSPNERTIIRNSTREPSTRGENKVRLCRSAGLQADTLQRDCRQHRIFARWVEWPNTRQRLSTTPYVVSFRVTLMLACVCRGSITRSWRSSWPRSGNQRPSTNSASRRHARKSCSGNHGQALLSQS